MRRSILLFGVTILSSSIFAQNKEQGFYTQQLQEYKQWLDYNRISANLKINEITSSIKGDTLIIELKSNYQSVDSLSAVWRNLDNFFVTGKRVSLADFLHQQGAFLMDLNPQLLRLCVFGPSGIQFRDVSYTTTIKDKSLLTMSGTPVVVSLEELRLPTSSKRIPLNGKHLVKAVSSVLSSQLSKYYGTKPSSWLYSVKVDTARSSYNKLVYRVSCLKNEIIDDGYFEFIEIILDIAQQPNSSIEVRLGLKGKYCGGLLCPQQREKFYYSMDTKYGGKLANYSDFLERKIEQWLSN